MESGEEGERWGGRECSDRVAEVMGIITLLERLPTENRERKKERKVI